MRFNTALEIPVLVENNAVIATVLLDTFPRKEQYTIENLYLFSFTGVRYCPDMECSIIFAGGMKHYCPLTCAEVLEKIHIHNQIDKL